MDEGFVEWEWGVSGSLKALLAHLSLKPRASHSHDMSAELVCVFDPLLGLCF